MRNLFKFIMTLELYQSAIDSAFSASKMNGCVIKDWSRPAPKRSRGLWKIKPLSLRRMGVSLSQSAANTPLPVTVLLPWARAASTAVVLPRRISTTRAACRFAVQRRTPTAILRSYRWADRHRGQYNNSDPNCSLQYVKLPNLLSCFA